jgi:hypothetical protein
LYIFLLLDNLIQDPIIDLVANPGLHKRASLVILDISIPDLALQLLLLRKAHLLEIANGIVIGVCEYVLDVLGLEQVFELVHEPAAVATHLFAGGDRQEGQFGERLRRESPEADPTDYLTAIREGMGK